MPWCMQQQKEMKSSKQCLQRVESKIQKECKSAAASLEKLAYVTADSSHKPKKHGNQKSL